MGGEMRSKNFIAVGGEMRRMNAQYEFHRSGRIIVEMGMKFLCRKEKIQRLAR